MNSSGNPFAGQSLNPPGSQSTKSSLGPSANQAVRFQEEEKRFAGRYEKSVFQTLRFAFTTQGHFAGLFVIGLIARLLILFNANLIGYWVDLLSQHLERVPKFVRSWESHDFVVAMMGITACGLIGTFVFRVGFARMSARAVSLLYDETTLRTSRYPLSFFDATPVGRVITRFSSDYGNVFRMFGGPLAEFINIVFDLISMLFLAVNASPYFLVIASIMVLFYFAIYRLNREPLRHARRKYSRARSPSIAHFAETAQGAAIIRAFSREAVFMRRFQMLNLSYLAERLVAVRRVVFFSFEMNALSAVLVVITGFGGYYLVELGRMSIGSLTVAFSFLLLSSSSLQMLFEWLSQFEEALVGVERLDEYLRRDIEPGLKLPAARQFETHHAVESVLAKPNTPAFGQGASVEIKDLGFRYRAELPFVLQQLSVQIRAGEKLGVVGRTGSGKSTLIQCLYYLYPLTSGAIKIDGFRPQFDFQRTAPDEISLNEYRKQIALISQESILFKGSLRDNLDMQGLESDARMGSVLERVGLASDLATRAGARTETARDISRILDLAVDERGRNLSMGQRQLICIARCLLQNAPVVVMDEATSSIDPQSEAILLRATQELFEGRTQIIIAHRLSTLMRCDRILWLKDGRVHRLGSVEEVLPEFQRDEAEVNSDQPTD